MVKSILCSTFAKSNGTNNKIKHNKKNERMYLKTDIDNVSCYNIN